MPDDNAIADLLRSFATAPDVTNLPPVRASAAVSSPLEKLSPDIGRFQRLSQGPTTRERNKAPGVPLDTETGPASWDMLWSSFRKDPEQIVKFWQDKYGADNVRLADTGVPIVRVMGDNGTPEDILVDPEKMTAKSLVKIAGQMPEFAGALLGSKGVGALMGASRGFARTATEATAMSVGAATAGALKDVAVRAEDEMPMGNILSERLGEIPVGIGANMLLAGGAKALSKVITPFGEVPPIQEDARQAAEYWRSRGVHVPFSAGERTGNLFLQRSEEEMKRLPGGTFGLQDIRKQQNAAFQQIQDALTGVPPGDEATRAAGRAALPSAESVGREATQVLRGTSEATEQELAASKEALTKESIANIGATVDASTSPVRQLYMTPVGKAIRERVQAELDSFRATSSSLYQKAYELEGGRGRILEPPSLATDAKEALKNLPPKSKTIETIDYDTYGSPILRTKQGTEVSKEFTPSNVIGKLEELATSDRTKFSLQDLVSMRNEVTNDIKVGEAVPGVQTHHLGVIRDMLTKAIKESTEALPTGDLRTAWEAANKHYADNVGKFHTHGIASILKEAEAPGSVGDAQIVSRLTGTSPRATDNFLDMKAFLGPHSPEFAMLKRSIADGIIEDSMMTNKELMDPKKFIGKLRELRRDQREVYDDVFGKSGDSLLKQAANVALANEKISTEDMAKILSDPAASPKLRDLVIAQRNRDELFKNSILKAVGSNTLPAEGINPGDFVNRFVTSSNPSEVQQAMDLIRSKSPDLAERIKFKTMESILNDAARNPTAQDRVAMRLDPSRVVSSFKLGESIGNPERQRVLEQIIGPEGISDLQNLAKVLRPVEAKQAAFASAGGISAGMAVRGFWQGGVFSFIDKALRNTVGAALLSFPATREYLANQVMTPQRTAQLITAAMATRPVMQELIYEYGQKGAIQAANRIKSGVNAYVRSAPSTTNTQPSKPASDEQILDVLRQQQ